MVLINPDNFTTVEIDKDVYLGNITGAQNLEFYTQKGIRGVVNVSRDLPFYHECNQMRIFIEDNASEHGNLLKQLPAVTEFIESNKPVLIHCYGGISRSPNVCAAWLMYKYPEMTPVDAVKRVKSKRDLAFSWGNFNETLNTFYTNMHKGM